MVGLTSAVCNMPRIVAAVIGERGRELCDDNHRDVPLQSTKHDTLPLRCVGEPISQ
jgi:hypothetical protein